MGNYFVKSAVTDPEVMDPIADRLKKFVTDPEVTSASQEVIIKSITDTRVTTIINSFLEEMKLGRESLIGELKLARESHIGELQLARESVTQQLSSARGDFFYYFLAGLGVAALFYFGKPAPTPPPSPQTVLLTPFSEGDASDADPDGLRVLLLKCDPSSLKFVQTI